MLIPIRIMIEHPLPPAFAKDSSELCFAAIASTTSFASDRLQLCLSLYHLTACNFAGRKLTTIASSSDTLSAPGLLTTASPALNLFPHLRHVIWVSLLPIVSSS